MPGHTAQTLPLSHKTRDHLRPLSLTPTSVQMELRLAALGIPSACQISGLFGPGGKALRHGAMRFLTQPSSRGTGVVHFETSTATPKFTARFCLGEKYWFVFSNADGSVYLYTHQPIYNVLVCENII